MPEQADLRSIITYIVTQLDDMDASFGKTKLVKLLYLIDVEFYRSFSRKLTNLEWIFYHYGPYALSLDQTFSELNFDIQQEDVLTTSGKKAKIFKPEKYTRSDLESSTGVDKIIIDRIIKSWGFSELNPLLSYVYFHTEPMIAAERNVILDFTKIKKYPSGSQKTEQLTSEFRKKLKEQFLHYKTSRLKNAGIELNPKPRFDNIFFEGLNRMDMEELSQLPNGKIGFDEELKGIFKQIS